MTCEIMFELPSRDGVASIEDRVDESYYSIFAEMLRDLKVSEVTATLRSRSHRVSSTLCV